MTDEEHRFSVAPHAVALSVAAELVMLTLLFFALGVSHWLMGG